MISKALDWQLIKYLHRQWNTQSHSTDITSPRPINTFQQLKEINNMGIIICLEVNITFGNERKREK